MTKYTRANNPGFGLLGILIAIAVLAIVTSGGIYLNKDGEKESLIEKGIDAKKQAEDLKNLIENQQKEVQNEIDGIPVKPMETIDTSNWKIHRNEKYGFEVKYFPEFQINPSVSGRPQFIEGINFSESENLPNISIGVYENQSQLSIENWYNSYLGGKEYVFSDLVGQKLEAIMIDGTQSLQIYSNVLGYHKLRTYIPFKNKVVGFEISVVDDTDIPEVYTQILSTFKFIK